MLTRLTRSAGSSSRDPFRGSGSAAGLQCRCTRSTRPLRNTPARPIRPLAGSSLTPVCSTVPKRAVSRGSRARLRRARAVSRGRRGRGGTRPRPSQRRARPLRERPRALRRRPRALRRRPRAHPHTPAWSSVWNFVLHRRLPRPLHGLAEARRRAGGRDQCTICRCLPYPPPPAELPPWQLAPLPPAVLALLEPAPPLAPPQL